MTRRKTTIRTNGETPWLSLGFSLSLAALCGCAPTPRVAADVTTPGMPNAQLALQRSMHDVDSQMAQIGALQPAPAGAASPASTILPAELTKPVQFVWSGPLDVGVQKLASSIGYTILISRPPKPRKLVVAVSINGDVISVFKAMGDQAGTKATVTVDPLHHAVQVTHHV